MRVSIEIIPIPSGSQFVQAIGANDPESLNDFRVRIVCSDNATGLTYNGITVSAGSSVISLSGDNVGWEATIRPATTAGTLTITVNANAFAEGNAQTSKDIRLSTSFPDTDAETTTQLLSFGGTGITITPTRIIVLVSNTLRFYTHAGVEQTAERISSSTVFLSAWGDIDWINGDILASRSANTLRRYRLDGVNTPIEIREHFTASFIGGITHSDLGIVTGKSGREIVVQKYGETSVKIVEYPQFGSGNTSFSGIQKIVDNYYFLTDANATEDFAYLTLTDDAEFEKLRYLNIDANNSIRDTALYGDTLYILHQSAIYTLDIKKYRPIGINTKTTIPIQFATEGDTIPLKQYCPDAHTIIFGVGMDKPSYLSINADNEIVIASSAVTETSPVLVKLTGINYIDSVDFEFYLVIEKAAAPVWRNVSSLTIRAGSSYDLFQIVPDAETIEFRSGRTRLAGSSLSNGIFRIGTVAGIAHFTARKGSRSSHIEIEIAVVQARDRSSFSDIFRHRVEIAGIDVTADVSVFPNVSATLDAVSLNVYQPNEVVLTLKSNNLNGYKYNEGGR